MKSSTLDDSLPDNCIEMGGVRYYAGEPKKTMFQRLTVSDGLTLGRVLQRKVLKTTNRTCGERAYEGTYDCTFEGASWNNCNYC